jgi:hypothetical protein
MTHDIADIADLIPVNQLQDRYHIKRSALYNRLSALNLQPVKVGRRAFVTQGDVLRMDALANHIEAGGTIHDFDEGIVTAASARAGSLVVNPETEIAPVNPGANFAAFLETFAARPSAPIQILTDRLDLLEKAATYEWLLPTSDLSMALGLSRHSIGKYPKFERYGFVFTKVGQQGTETAWRVEKAMAKTKKKGKH